MKKDFLFRAVKIMRPEIRYSDHVRLAVTAFSAIHSSNYSRFFSIVRQATYLQAALLHRYFNQVSFRGLFCPYSSLDVTTKNRSALFKR